MQARQVVLAAALVLLLAACSPPAPSEAAAPAVQPAPLAADGPPTIGGLYIAKDACPGEGCYLMGRIRAREPADLYDKAGAGAAVTGKVATGEWVEIEAREEHLVPLRGVVREGRSHFATGEVVYLLSSQGEGCYSVWSKGEVKSWCDPDAVGDIKTDEAIDISDFPPPDPEGAGLWVKVKGATSGWIKGTDGFACTGYQDRDADCPPLPQ